MARSVFAAILAWFALTGVTLAEQTDAGESLRLFLGDVVSLKADFTQSLFTADSETPQVSSGTLLIKRPGRFRWEYEQPALQLVICDGGRIWMYDEDLEQVTVRPVDETLRGTPAMLLSGQATLDDTFEILKSYSDGDLDWVDLKPRDGSPEFVSLSIALRQGILQRMELTDSLGQVTQVELDDIKVDAEVADDLFVFEPPPGVDVIGVGGSR
ncbi:MAG: outer membrane lipoprotein chaperone LolA [Chromatiales bacterium]|nr:outer membrane lipoprotein chaperone LolA [Chromatiales bacterium]